MSSITPLSNSPSNLEVKQGQKSNVSPRSFLIAQDHNQKKRLFVRKPCASPSYNIVDKKRKQANLEELTNEASFSSFKRDKEQDLIKQNQGVANNDESLRCQVMGQSSQVSWKRDMFFKPSASQNQLLSGLKYIHRKSFRTSKQELKSNLLQDMKKEMDQTTDYSGESRLQGCKSINTIRCIPLNLENSTNSDAQKFSGTPTRSKQLLQERWCINCRSNMQRCQLLTQRCNQLEEQLQLKNKLIKEMSQKMKYLSVEKKQREKQIRQLLQSDGEMRQIIENLQRRAMKSQQQFTCSFEGAKKELQRLNDKLKYSEMENTMLLRYKEEYCMMGKECDKYRHENDNLKRQLNNIARMDNNFNFSKQKTKYSKPVIPQTDRHKLPKAYTPMNKEEDAISLDLSQWSVQQHD